MPPAPPGPAPAGAGHPSGVQRAEDDQAGRCGQDVEEHRHGLRRAGCSSAARAAGPGPGRCRASVRPVVPHRRLPRVDQRVGVPRDRVRKGRVAVSPKHIAVVQPDQLRRAGDHRHHRRTGAAPDRVLDAVQVRGRGSARLDEHRQAAAAGQADRVGVLQAVRLQPGAAAGDDLGRRLDHRRLDAAPRHAADHLARHAAGHPHRHGRAEFARAAAVRGDHRGQHERLPGGAPGEQGRQQITHRHAPGPTSTIAATGPPPSGP